MEHLTLQDGLVEVEVDGKRKKPKAGGTARCQADKSRAIRNAGKSEAKVLLVVIHRWRGANAGFMPFGHCKRFELR